MSSEELFAVVGNPNSVITKEALTRASYKNPEQIAEIIKNGGILVLTEMDKYQQRNIKEAIKSNAETPLYWE